jgi:hypothetical protein
LQEAYNDAIDFLFRIDEPSPEAIEDAFYESLSEYKVREAEKSTWAAFSKSKFFKLLPPRMQGSLITVTLEKHMSLLEFFF